MKSIIRFIKALGTLIAKIPVIIIKGLLGPDEYDENGRRIRGGKIRGIGGKQMKQQTDYDNLSDAEEISASKRFLNGLKEDLGGELVTRRDDDGSMDFFYLKFSYRDRPCRVVMDPSWGTPELQIKMKNTTGILAIKHNMKMKQEHITVDPEWDAVDKRSVKLFLAPGIIIDEYHDEMSAMVTLIQEMPEGLIGEITAFIADSNVEYLLYDAMIIDAEFGSDIFKRNYREQLPAILDMFMSHCEFFESGNRNISPKPKVYISGRPAMTGSIPGITECSYCHAAVLRTAGGACGNCGAPL